MTPTTAMKPKLVEKDPLPVSVHVRLDLIAPSPTNRRTSASADLIASVKQHGVMSDVLLRPVVATEEHLSLTKGNGAFSVGQEILELVFGERRYWASVANKLTSVPGKIRNLSDSEAIRLQVDENDNRENYSAMDRANAYEQLRKQFMKDHEGQKYSEGQCIQDIATERNVETRIVYQVLALLKLHEFVQAALNQEEMVISHAYEFCRLEQDQQLDVLKWLRKETYHSQGDIPSVRRLKRHISEMSIVWDAQKRQAELPLEGKEEKTQTSAEDEELANPSVPKSVMDEYQKQKSATAPKPLSKAQIKKNEAAVAAEIAANLKHQREAQRARKTEKAYRGLFFTALASKVNINSRFLSHLVPALLLEIWDRGDVPFEPFCQNFLGWPAPKDGDCYEYDEVLELSKRHTRKFTSKLLAALIITLNLDASDEQRLAKYNGVDPKKLRAKAAAAVKEEELQALIPKTPSTQREKQLHHALNGDEARWKKLRKLGASNAELREVLGEMWDLGGGSHSKELGSVEWKGGSSPSIVFDSKAKDALAGAALIQEVRDLLKIPEKGVAA